MVDKHFQPKGVISRAEQKHKVGDLTLEGDKDPDNYAGAITTLNVGYQNVLRKDDKIAAIYSVTGDNYATTLLSQQNVIKSREGGLTFDTQVKRKHTQWHVRCLVNNFKGRNE